MKRFVSDFFHRGFIACGIGPVVLAIVYWILKQTAGLQSLSVDRVCIEILSITALSFIAGGTNAIYQIERLPLMVAILIHGAVLYISYLTTYLINGWLDAEIVPVIVFSAVFVVGYIVIWAVIYCIIRRKTARLNTLLAQNRRHIPPEQ